MICPSCGVNNYNTATNCVKCGFPLVQRQQYIPPPQPNPTNMPIVQPPFPIQRMPYQPLKPINPPPQVGTVPNQPLNQTTTENLQQQTDQNIQPVKPNLTLLGIKKPTFGICSLCNRDMLRFYDNGDGECMNCGRTFCWYNPNANQEFQDNLEEDNPFIVKEDEILPESERKMEVEADSEVYHKASTKTVDLEKKSLDLGNRSKQTSKLDDEKRLMMLEDRFAKGEISEEVYDNLHEKLQEKLLQTLEDQFISGNISEVEFKTKKKRFGL